MTTNVVQKAFNYVKYLLGIAIKDAEVVEQKDRDYGASWLEYGGVSAFFATVRKWDRIRVQLKKVGWDVFEAYAQDRRQEGFMDDVRDLRRYLMLWEARAVDLGLVPEDQGYFHFGQNMVICDEDKLRTTICDLLTKSSKLRDGPEARTFLPADQAVTEALDSLRIIV